MSTDVILEQRPLQHKHTLKRVLKVWSRRSCRALGYRYVALKAAGGQQGEIRGCDWLLACFSGSRRLLHWEINHAPFEVMPHQSQVFIYWLTASLSKNDEPTRPLSTKETSLAACELTLLLPGKLFFRIMKTNASEDKLAKIHDDYLLAKLILSLSPNTI